MRLRTATFHSVVQSYKVAHALTRIGFTIIAKFCRPVRFDWSPIGAGPPLVCASVNNGPIDNPNPVGFLFDLVL